MMHPTGVPARIVGDAVCIHTTPQPLTRIVPPWMPPSPGQGNSPNDPGVRTIPAVMQTASATSKP